MTRAMLGSQRICCGWAQHRQDSFWTSCAAVDGVTSDSSPGIHYDIHLLCALRNHLTECSNCCLLLQMAVQETDLNLQAEPASTNVYIGNISAEVTDAELKQLADQYGVVVDMRLNRKGGYAFVQVYSSDMVMLFALYILASCFQHLEVTGHILMHVHCTAACACACKESIGKYCGSRSSCPR